jgi:hypothetical protein
VCSGMGSSCSTSETRRLTIKRQEHHLILCRRLVYLNKYK